MHEDFLKIYWKVLYILNSPLTKPCFHGILSFEIKIAKFNKKFFPTSQNFTYSFKVYFLVVVNAWKYLLKNAYHINRGGNVADYSKLRIMKIDNYFYVYSIPPCSMQHAQYS